MRIQWQTTAILAIATASFVESQHRPHKRWLPAIDKIRGVNLGSQFILEPWMARDEWRRMGCENRPDEWSCVADLGQNAADRAFRSHWQTWITADDLREIKSYGLNTVRIPVGFWINENLVGAGEHYPRGGLEYLDYLVGNASALGLYVIMDLHAGPGAQFPVVPYTGHVVVQPGFYTPYNYERACRFLEWMTERIHTHAAYASVGMLQVLNEPVHSDNYPWQAADMVANFYPGAWNRIRQCEADMGIAVRDKLHIQFMAESWGAGNPSQNLRETRSIFYDDHRYFKWDTTVGGTPEAYIAKACADNRGGSDTIVGEWSLAVADDVQYTSAFDVRADANKAWYRDFFAAQVHAFERSGGWVFWSWKVDPIAGIEDWRWCYKGAVEAGVIPKNAATVAGMSAC
ncbi:glycoside hydrolase superfamily [Nemania sp. FL0916]|nr:glycoside hydrolase superfamily [Nemania sp. FL0916]